MYIRVLATDNLKGETTMSKKVRTLLSTLLLVALFATLVPSAFAASDILIASPTTLPTAAAPSSCWKRSASSK